MIDKMTISDLTEAKQQGRKIAAVSCYDYTTARLADKAGIDMLLVGDSAAEVMLGFDSTLPATMDFMVAITAAVRRGAPRPFLVADMPFLSYQISIAKAIENAGRFIVESSAQMVKMEVTSAQIEMVKAVSDTGIAVMAHIGIKPQSINQIGRFKADATTADMAAGLVSIAEQMEKAGAKALLIEGCDAEAAAIVTKNTDLPVIGCGSGNQCDGQILISHDILGLVSGKKPKFAKNYCDLNEQTIKAFTEYAKDVRDGQYPDSAHSYHMKKGQLKQFGEMMGFLHE